MRRWFSAIGRSGVARSGDASSLSLKRRIGATVAARTADVA
jgi:hypothetical protein